MQKTIWLVAMGLLIGTLAVFAVAQPQRPPRPAGNQPAVSDWPPLGDNEVQFSGQVIDDQTGKPVEKFILEWGEVFGGKKADDPGAIAWGGLTERRARPDKEGKFRTSPQWQKGQMVNMRVVADGYLPEPVSPQPITVPKRLDNLTVRLKRGSTLRGFVLDQQGNPLARADIYLVSQRRLELTEEEQRTPSKPAGTTDDQGRFAITGSQPKDQKLVIVAPHYTVALANVPDASTETTFHLSPGATMKIQYDIPGAPPQGEFRLELMTWEMPDWKNVASFLRMPKVENGQALNVEGLPPGKYDFTRIKTWRLGGMGGEFFCERRTVTLAAGESLEHSFIRTKGAPVRGTVDGLAKIQAPGATITVRAAEAAENPGDWKLPTYDGQTCGPDGTFTTETLAPGTYTVVAQASTPMPAGTPFRTGLRLPDYVGIAKVTVPETGQPPEVKVQLKPRSEGLTPPPTSFATQPAAK